MTDELERYIAQHIDAEGDYLYRLWRATNVHTIRSEEHTSELQSRI